MSIVRSRSRRTGPAVRRISSIPSPWQIERSTQAEREKEKLTTVLHTAAIAFARYGYHETSMDDIAGSLGVSKPTLYLYYKTKADLLNDCHSYAMERFLPAARAMVEHPGSSIEKLQVYFRFNLECMTSEVGRALYVIDETAKNERIREKNKKIKKEIARMMRGIISDGIKDGEIDSRLDPKMVVLAMFGAFNFMPRWYRDDGARTTNEIGEQFFSIFFDGLKPRRQRPRARPS